MTSMRWVEIQFCLYEITTRENAGLFKIADRRFVVIRPAEHISEGAAESPVLPGQIMAHPAAHVS